MGEEDADGVGGRRKYFPPKPEDVANGTEERKSEDEDEWVEVDQEDTRW